MQRPIKFRAWCYEHGVMFIPSYLDCKRGKVFEVIGSKCAENGFKDNGGHGSVCFELMLFTGLKDKNGKEIYEGDILSCREGFMDRTWKDQIGVVEWNCSAASFSLVTFKDKEVIGNQWENPELIPK
jgi:uncharacterized phage protein (TIGR01671 family)